MAGISYMFPPDQIGNLPTWRFLLHFEITPSYRDDQRKLVIAALKAAQWKIVTFPFGLDEIDLDDSGRALTVPIEVPEGRRRRANSLADYESDVWKVMGNVMQFKAFGEIFYEAVDWEG